jgi:myo-inositol-1(or 4)-monophosphatase
MLNTAMRAARAAGEELMERYGSALDVNVKGLRDISTEADLAAERAALAIIRQESPEGLIMAEEMHHERVEDPDRPVWYVDPLDGTTNYARGLPSFSVSVGVSVHGVVRCGVVYAPLVDQCFWAEQGGGAYLNGKRLRASTRSTLMDGLVLLDWPRNQAQRELAAAYLARLAARVDAVRSFGSAALGFCYVAAGWAEAFFQYTLSAWDVAAGMLIVQEAGGRVSSLRGAPAQLHQPDWLATNGHLHDAILALDPFAS